MATLTVSASEQQRSLYLDTDGRATVVFTAYNGGDDTVSGSAEIFPEGGAGDDWFQVVDSRHRVFHDREALQFKVKVAVPPSTSAGTFGLRLVVVNEDDPEGDFAESECVKLHWNPQAVKRVNRVLLILLALLTVAGAIAIAAVIYLAANREIRPQELLGTANSAAAAGDWDAYWDCWTDEGQDELLVRVAGLLAERRRSGSQSDGLQAWIRGFGVAPADLQEVQDHALVGDTRILETSRMLKQRFQAVGRSEKDFFVGAAKWLESETDSDSNPDPTPSEFRGLFHYEIERQLPLDDSLAADVAVWEGGQVPVASGNARDGETLRIVFHKADRHWLLHDVYPPALTRRTVWERLSGRNVSTRGPIVRLETTNRPAAGQNEPRYEDEVRVTRESPVTKNGPADGRAPEEIVGTLDQSADRLTIKIDGKSRNARILPPFLILTDDASPTQVFVDVGAGVTVGNLLYLKWSDVKPILGHDPFDRKIALLKVDKTSGRIDDCYIHSMLLAKPKVPPDPPPPGAPAGATSVPGQATPAATVDLPVVESVTEEEKLNERTELRWLDPGKNAEDKSDVAADKFLIIELVEKDPLAIEGDPIMKALERDLQVKIAIAAEAGPLPEGDSPGDSAKESLRSQPAAVESVIRRTMDRNGFDYFIDYMYEPDGPWFDWGWVPVDGRKRLRITLNRFGYELWPTEKTDLWGGNSLAFRRETDGLRMAVGDNMGDIMLDSRLQLNVRENSWSWSGADEHTARLSSGLDASLKGVNLPGGSTDFSLTRRRGPIDWSGTSTVMPYDKYRFALGDERSAAERAFGSVAVSPDGRWLVGGDSRGRLRIWRQRDDGRWNLTQETPLGDLLRAFFPQIELQMRGVAFSADAGRIAVAVTVMFQKKDGASEQLPQTGYVMVLRRDAEAMPYFLLPRLEVAGTAPLCVAFHRNAPGDYLAAGLADGTVKVWKWNGVRYQDNHAPETEHQSAVLSLVFGPLESGRGNWLAVGHADGRVQLTARTGDSWLAVPRFRFSRSNGQAVHSLAFSPRGALLAGAAYDGVRLWQLRDVDVERSGAP